jgi:hypothetical protein
MGMIWDKFAFQFERNYASAERFFNTNGHLKVPANYIDENGVSLGAWIRYLRTYQKDGYVSEEQRVKLNAIGMNWSSDYDRLWEQKYKEAELFYQKNGHLDMPATYVTESGVSLGRWVYNQRYAREMPGITNNKLTEDRIKKLDAIGMIWQVQDSWDKRYELAKQFYDTSGHLNIPHTYYTENKIWLGKWVYLQRKAARNGKITDEQIQKLTDIGMNWNTPNEDAWENNFNAVKDFYEKHGHLNVPIDYCSANGKLLRGWMKNQRKYRKLASNKLLTPERIERLDSIGLH